MPRGRAFRNPAAGVWFGGRCLFYQGTYRHAALPGKPSLLLAGRWHSRMNFVKPAFAPPARYWVRRSRRSVAKGWEVVSKSSEPGR